MQFPVLRALAIAGLAAVLTTHAASAQRTEPSRVRALVVAVDSVPNTSTAFVILRRVEGHSHDVILLRSDATPEQLSEAVHALVLIRRQHGDTAVASATLRVRPGEGARRAAPRALPWAPRVLADLRRAQRRQVPGVGNVPVVEIWLPRQQAPPS